MKKLDFGRHGLVLSLASATALGLPACGDDNGGGDTDGDTDTDTGTDTAATDTATATATATMTATATATATESTTMDSDSDSNTSGPTATDTAATDSGPDTDGTGSDTDGTDTDGTDTDGTDTDGTGTTGAAGASVSGIFRRDQAVLILPPDDGIGIAYIGLLDACDAEAERIAGTEVPDADISDAANEVPFTIEDVPDGTWYLTGFFDDDENADPGDPAPDMGDLAASEDFGPACVEVTVDGADVTDLELVYNFRVPF